MKFKEFANWCNERACDGCWGMKEAMLCCEICQTIYNKPFWKREKFWKECCKNTVVLQIIEQTNKKIKELQDVK